MCQKVIVVASNDLQSLYVANNVCKAVEYFRKMGGNVGVAGMILNKDDGTGEANAFAEAVGIPVLTAIPANEDIRKKSANYQIIGKPGGQWASLFEELAINVAEAPPLRPAPLDQDGLLGPVQRRRDRRGLSAEARDPGRHARRGLRRQAEPRSRVRRGLIVERRSPSPRSRPDRPGGARRSRAAAARRTRCAPPRSQAGKSDILDRYAADYPQGPARPAAIDVPGVRLAARRPAHAPHRDRALGLGLLRLRPDLHLALLRREAQRRLRPVLAPRRSSPASCSRTSATRSTSSPIRRSTTRSSSPTCACRPHRACRCSCCPTRSTASA